MLNARMREQGGCSSSDRCLAQPQPQIHLREPARLVQVLCRTMSPAKEALDDVSGHSWTYKYPWMRCISRCGKDPRCLQMEALVQNVLSYPSLSPRICNHLPKVAQDMDGITEVVERMAEHFGKELAYVYISRQPWILDLTFDTMLERMEQLQKIIGFSADDIPMVLKKEPRLLMLDGSTIRDRYQALSGILNYPPQQVFRLVKKYPPILMSPSQVIANKLAALRHLCSAREQWVRDVDSLPSNLLVFFLRDTADCLLRLEYLASTGERQDYCLRNVFKISNRNFYMKFKGFVKWRDMVRDRRQRQRQAMRDAHMSAEAASIKEALLTGSSSGSSRSREDGQGAGSSSSGSGVFKGTT